MALIEAEFLGSTVLAGEIPENDGIQGGFVFHKIHERQKKRTAEAFGDIPAADADYSRLAAGSYQAYDGLFA